MIKNKNNKKNRPLRLLFLYSFIVCFIIFFSLLVKAAFVIKQSRFDGRNFNLAIAKNNKVIGILGFNSTTNSISFLKIRKSNIDIKSVSRELGIIPDAKLNSERDLTNESITSILTKSILKNDSIDSGMTIFDIVRLIIQAKSVKDNDYKEKEIQLNGNIFDTNKIISSLFKNDSIVLENLSIQIINATEESGLGNRLERSLNNIGANVIFISTAHKKRANSVIQYYGNKGYSVVKLRKLLNFPIEELKEKSIADIIIIIGEDSQNTSVF